MRCKSFVLSGDPQELFPELKILNDGSGLAKFGRLLAKVLDVLMFRHWGSAET
jgi:hypothetical protein